MKGVINSKSTDSHSIKQTIERASSIKIKINEYRIKKKKIE